MVNEFSDFINVDSTKVVINAYREMAFITAVSYFLLIAPNYYKIPLFAPLQKTKSTRTEAILMLALSL